MKLMQMNLSKILIGLCLAASLVGIILILLILVPSVILANIISSIVVALLMIPITYYITKYILEANRIKRWEKINKKVLQDLDKELLSLLSDIAMYCEFDTRFTSEKMLSSNEIEIKDNYLLLKELKKHSNQKTISLAEEYKKLVLTGYFGQIFNNRQDYFNQFQLKYLEYLDAEPILCLMEIQENLHYIDQEIRIKIKGNQVESDERVIKRIEKYLQTIVDNLQKLHELGFLTC